MKTMVTMLALALSLQAGSAVAQECLNLDSGEILCDDGSHLYYWSPAAGQWQVFNREEAAAALNVDPADGSASAPAPDGGGSVAYGDDSSLTTTGDDCTMFSAPGYGFGESLSFSSGC